MTVVERADRELAAHAPEPQPEQLAPALFGRRIDVAFGEDGQQLVVEAPGTGWFGRVVHQTFDLIHLDLVE